MARREEDEPELPGTPQPSAGSAEPGPFDPEEKAPAPRLDEDLLAESGTVPRTDALDPGDPDAPVETLDTGSGAGPGAGGRHEGGVGGTDIVAGAQRQQASDTDRGDRPAPDDAPQP